MSESKISKQVFEKIKNIRPRPRWQFLLRDYSVWILGFVSLVLGAIAFSVILFMMANNDWDIYQEISSSFLKFLFITLPYFWLVFLLLFLFTAYYNFKHTRQGYKFPFYQISLLSIFASMLFGSLFYNFGVGQAIEDSFNEDVPLYQEIFNTRKKIWARPDKGFLAGFVVSVDSDKFLVQDVDGQTWEIKKSANFHCPPMKILTGLRLRLMGDKIDSQTFEVDCILPLRDMRWMHQLPTPGIERNMPRSRIIR